MPDKFQKIIQNYDDLDWWKRIALPHMSRRGGKYLTSILGPIVYKPYYYLNGGRSDFPAEDWDVAIILDACRYDFFAEHHKLPGELEYRISKGGTTADFLLNNFANQNFHDTVYVTANPHVSHLLDGQFHDIIHVWEYGWNEDLKTVTPDVLAEEAEKAAREYPNKRIIAHFMQPHQPYIGKTREKLGQHSGNLSARQTALKERSETRDKKNESDERIIRKIESENQVAEMDGIPHIFPLVNAGVIDIETIKQAYKENLNIVLEQVSMMMEDIEGRIVVTADHGELLQDRTLPFLPFFKNYGHFGSPYPPGLVKVPWLIHQPGERRETTTEPPITTEDNDESEIEDKLKHLGYLDK